MHDRSRARKTHCSNGRQTFSTVQLYKSQKVRVCVFTLLVLTQYNCNIQLKRFGTFYFIITYSFSQYQNKTPFNSTILSIAKERWSQESKKGGKRPADDTPF
jgi:hypothetical protein